MTYETWYASQRLLVKDLKKLRKIAYKLALYEKRGNKTKYALLLPQAQVELEFAKKTYSLILEHCCWHMGKINVDSWIKFKEAINETIELLDSIIPEREVK